MKIDELISRAGLNYGESFAKRLASEISEHEVGSIDAAVALQRRMLRDLQKERNSALSSNIAYRSRLVKPLMAEIARIESGD